MEEVEKAISGHDNLSNLYKLIKLSEETALHYGEQCNISDALHQMSVTRERTHQLEDVARSGFFDGKITRDEYLDVVFGVEKYLAWDLEEKIATQILNNCDCSKKS